MEAWSIKKTNAVMISVAAITTLVDSVNCSRVGQETFFISTTTSLVKDLIFPNIFKPKKFARVVGLEPTARGFGDRYSTN